MGTEEGIALLGHRAWKAMGAADVFLKGVEITHDLRAKVTLKEGIRQAGQNGSMLLCIVDLFEMLI